MKKNIAQPAHKIEPSYESFLSATIEHIKALIKQHITPSNYKNFLLWLLKDDNPHRNNYLQMTGVNKMVELDVALLSGLFDDAIQQSIASYLGRLNAYFFFEVVSDNLAIGLSSREKLSSSAQMRREILLHFNTIMQQKLMGDETKTSILLSKQADNIKAISSHEQSLATTAIRRIAASYVAENPGSSLDELDYSILNYLILNIEACVNLSPSIRQSIIHTKLNEQLKNRYFAVNVLLQDKGLSDLSVLADYGKATILVIATLIYIIAAIDNIEPIPHLNEILTNGTLLNSIADAASIVRMDNDIGTKLLASSEEYKIKLKGKLLELSQQSPSRTLTELLLNIAQTQEFSRILSRIRKDIVNNEFNISLANIQNLDTKSAIAVFCNNLEFFTQLNQHKHQNLSLTLKNIDQTLKSNKIGLLILRMVKFHEQLYSEDFDNNKGEYAIPSTLNKH